MFLQFKRFAWLAQFSLEYVFVWLAKFSLKNMFGLRNLASKGHVNFLKRDLKKHLQRKCRACTLKRNKTTRNVVSTSFRYETEAETQNREQRNRTR